MQDQLIQISNVKVCVRIRPFLPRQIINNDCQSITHQSDYSIVVGNQSFRFDRVFDQNSTQEEIYNSSIRHLLDGYFKGYNATLLAYGQTGSGKTYTMGTSGIESQGIIQLVIDDIFRTIESNKSQVRYNVQVSFIEVYNQEVYDLLNQNMKRNSSSSLPVRQNRDKSISVVGVKQQITENKQDVLKLLSQGNCKRCTASNGVNNLSSRSHAIFTISISQLPKKQDVSESEEIRSKFHFVDLAGSERLKKTKAEGTTLNEGININKGLLHLGEVIKALSNAKTNKYFVPYRNSKLTRLLQDSLGGNSNTQVIGCISPSSSSFQQTINTLKYAQRAMNIQNKPIINRDPSSNQILLLKHRILQLQEENSQLRGNQYYGVKKSQNSFQDSYQYKTQLDKWEVQVESLQSQLKANQIKTNQLEIEHLNIKTERDQLLMYLQTNKTKIEIPQQFRIDVFQEYKIKIAKLQEDNKMKQTRIFDLEKELGHYLVCFKRDDDILMNKLRQIETLKKQIGILDHNQQQFDEDSHPISMSDESELVDEQFQTKKSDFNDFSENLNYEIGEVEEFINNREKMLKDLNNSQILIENQLIELMKEQHGAKIKQFQAEKQKLQNDLRIAAINQNKNTVNALKMKKEQLEQKLKLCSKKIKQQERLQKAIQQKEAKISKLKEDISKSKMDRIQMGRKLKEERQNFERYKQMKGRDIINLNRIKMNRQKQIKKLNYKNHQKDLTILKTKQINAKLKKEKQNLIKLMKVGKKKPSPTLNQKQKQANSEFKMAQEIINKISEDIINNNQIQKIKDELHETINQTNELNDIFNRKSLEILRLEHQGNGEFLEESNEYLKDLKQQIEVLEKKQTHLRNLLSIQSKNPKFEYESEIIYNTKLDNIHVLRSLLTEILFKVENILIQRNIQEDKIYQSIVDNDLLQQKIKELNNNLFYQQQDHKQNLRSLRKELAVKNCLCQNLMSKVTMSKDETKKQLQKAMKQLRDLARDNQQYRKVNGVLTDKYQGARKMIDKDKFIGINNRTEDSYSNKISTFRQRRIQRSFEVSKSKSNSNNRSNHSSYDKKLGNQMQNLSGDSEAEQKYSIYDNLEENSMKNNDPEQLICVDQILAHDSPINYLELSVNTLISTATKSIKIWDTEKLRLKHQLNKFPTVVKSAAISQENSLIIAGSGSSLSMWDSRTYHQVRSMRRSDQIIKTMKLRNNLLYVGGYGGLQIWDVRNGVLIEQKEKKEDIVAMTIYNNTVFYGARDHYIKQMTENRQIRVLSPPHYDIVVSLSTLDDYLISASRDKSLKLWAINQYNEVSERSRIVAHSSLINTVCTDPDYSLIFSGTKDGNVKVLTVDREKDKLEVLGQTNCHRDSVNAMICKARTLMTGSADRYIKIWRPGKQRW